MGPDRINLRDFRVADALFGADWLAIGLLATQLDISPNNLLESAMKHQRRRCQRRR